MALIDKNNCFCKNLGFFKARVLTFKKCFVGTNKQLLNKVNRFFPQLVVTRELGILFKSCGAHQPWPGLVNLSWISCQAQFRAQCHVFIRINFALIYIHFLKFPLFSVFSQTTVRLTFERISEVISICTVY